MFADKSSVIFLSSLACDMKRFALEIDGRSRVLMECISNIQDKGLSEQSKTILLKNGCSPPTINAMERFLGVIDDHTLWNWTLGGVGYCAFDFHYLLSKM